MKKGVQAQAEVLVGNDVTDNAVLQNEITDKMLALTFTSSCALTSTVFDARCPGAGGALMDVCPSLLRGGVGGGGSCSAADA